MTSLKRLSAANIAVCTALLFFILPALTAVHFHHFGYVQFLESDTYYYLNVARFSQHVPFFSFDGVKPTNGFHPLWQWIEYWSVKVGFFPVLDDWKTLQHLFFLNLAVLSVAVGMLAWFIARQLRQTWLVFWVFCPGVLWFLFSHQWGFFSVWNNLNGMESAVELFFFGATLLAFVHHEGGGSLRWLAAANVLAGLMLLSRLDDVFFLLPLTIFSLSAARVSVAKRLAASAPPYLMLAAYLAYNLHSLGILMPISGRHKAGFELKDNLVYVSRYLLPIHSWSHKFSLVGGAEIYYHLLQMVIPAAVCIAFLCWKWHRGTLRHDLMMYVAVGVILKAAYNFAIVEIMLQGHWYYGPSIVFANMLLILGIDRMIGVDAMGKLFPRTGQLYPALASAAAAVFMFGMLMQYFPAQDDFSFYRVQTAGPELRKTIEGFGDKRFVEFDDGEIAFASGLPSVSGFGLTGDPESVIALEQGHFLPLMESRGITLIGVGAQYHVGHGDIHAADAPTWMWGGLRGSEFQKFYWKYLGDTKDVYFYRLTRE